MPVPAPVMSTTLFSKFKFKLLWQTGPVFAWGVPPVDSIHISIDRNKRLKEQAHLGHNRWHPELEPSCEVAEGQALMAQIRDVSDGQMHRAVQVQDLSKMEGTLAHPLTGPFFIKGAQPGDVLEIEYLKL